MRIVQVPRVKGVLQLIRIYEFLVRIGNRRAQAVPRRHAAHAILAVRQNHKHRRVQYVARVSRAIRVYGVQRNQADFVVMQKLRLRIIPRPQLALKGLNPTIITQTYLRRGVTTRIRLVARLIRRTTLIVRARQTGECVRRLGARQRVKTQRRIGEVGIHPVS